MKTTIALAVALIVGAIGTVFAITLLHKPITVEKSVLWDITDKHTASLNPADISNLFDFTGGNKWNGYIFNFTYVSDVSLTALKTASIPSANMWLSNEFERDKADTAFLDKVSGIITDSSSHVLGKANSSVYLPIADELNRLTKSPASTKEVYIISDLMENTNEVSFYDPKTLAGLNTDPKLMEQIFEDIEPISSLSGIDVHLIYQPLSPEKDNQYRTVAAFYQAFLEQKGATVTIQSSFTQ